LQHTTKIGRTKSFTSSREVANTTTAGLDWTQISARTSGDAAEHVTLNHGSLSLTKPNQGVFYGDPVSTVEDAWAIAQQNGLKPVTVGNRDIYVVPRPNSGYAGGMVGNWRTTTM
jgi:filamentous hemagglutinin